MAANATLVAALNSQASRDLNNMQAGIDTLVEYHKWSTDFRNTGALFSWDPTLWNDKVEPMTREEIDEENQANTGEAIKNKLDRRNAATLITRSIKGHAV
jgi:hypothetical protein